MKKRNPGIIKDKKLRGEWAESVFMARAGEHGLAVSKPWGDSRSFDCVVGRPGKFVAVQVKCTVAKLESGKGYICSVCSSHKAYRAGAFDFVAAYVVLEDLWYIIPAKLIRGKKSISLCTEGRRLSTRSIGRLGVFCERRRNWARRQRFALKSLRWRSLRDFRETGWSGRRRRWIIARGTWRGTIRVGIRGAREANCGAGAFWPKRGRWLRDEWPGL